MMRWILLLVLIAFTSCKSGMLPCPEVKGPKLKQSKISKRKSAERSMVASSVSLHDDQLPSKTYKMPTNEHALKHVSVEEWDCPQPGKKNMPKVVKQNIKKNQKRLKSYYAQKIDTVAISSSFGAQAP